jgi:hypothetical protein
MKAGFLAAVVAGCLMAAGNSAAQSAVPNMPAALSVPNPLAGLQPGPVDLYKVDRDPSEQTPRPTNDRFQKLTHPNPLFVPDHGLISVGLWPYAVVGYHQPPPRVRQPIVERGGLRFDTLPGNAQIFVDGSYVGIVEDYRGGRALDLSAGLHRISLRAPDYEPLDFDVRIIANQTVRYRGDMTRPVPIASTSPRPSPIAQAKTYYVIPNCYAGDRAPTRPLPRGCDIKDLRTIGRR